MHVLTTSVVVFINVSCIWVGFELMLTSDLLQEKVRNFCRLLATCVLYIQLTVSLFDAEVHTLNVESVFYFKPSMFKSIMSYRHNQQTSPDCKGKNLVF